MYFTPDLCMGWGLTCMCHVRQGRVVLAACNTLGACSACVCIRRACMDQVYHTCVHACLYVQTRIIQGSCTHHHVVIRARVLVHVHACLQTEACISPPLIHVTPMYSPWVCDPCRVWSMASGKCHTRMYVVGRDMCYVRCLALSDDGKKVVPGTDDSKLR